jgi:UDP-glucose 4-epimerase
MNNTKLFIITGGCGFIGSYMVDKLISLNHKVIVLDNLITGSIDNLNSNENVIYINVDISNLDSLKNALYIYNNIDGIFHFAEYSDNEWCVNNTSLCYNTNVIGTINILEIAKLKNIKKVILASTNIINTNIKTPYEISKKIIENIIMGYNNLNITILRYPNVYGKKQRNNTIYHNFFKKVNDKLHYYTNQINKKIYIHVDDIVNVNLLAYNNDFNGVLDITNDNQFLLTNITNFFDSNCIEYIYDKCDYSDYNIQDLNKANAILNWKPEIKLEDGIVNLLNEDEDSKIINKLSNIHISDLNTNNNNSFGFIILRHVNNEQTNLYWQKCYISIRKFYPEQKIVIIDDNSDKNFLKSNIELINTTIIESEYPKRGELLPYYYYLKYNFFDMAIIIHDSTIINSMLDLNIENYAMLWDIDHLYDDVNNEMRLLKLFNNENLINFYLNKKQWKGCFGGMSVIKYNFLEHINSRFNLSILLKHVNTRSDRSALERVLACLFQLDNRYSCLICCINTYPGAFELKYEHLHHINPSNMGPVIKYWTGR